MRLKSVTKPESIEIPLNEANRELHQQRLHFVAETLSHRYIALFYFVTLPVPQTEYNRIWVFGEK
jgi:hypothetical protein